ncbi:glycosyltransferase family 2 protein [Candidatus Saganbacteria bacterium CG08_land_8_20_14_0_20_45_16]|uniref:Glycosyltransferase family 2 protein n=1 Tax=Candidatus Saganbacteria bacterium CG08_land_8_20_14_0_20_45_16 TaxID=2014293 RepID=A0A2H0Y421_UNCSA|nr:MAG: glycosyltransferase family 2 protein [Candidatus Saganbacteria bacterium CG08_land_8_20_14_0_20_45_16]
MLDLSIIIVSWNVEKLLRDCLASIFQNQDNLELEVFVSDNLSSDGTAKMVTTEFPQVKYLQNESNLGFTKGNNRAFKQATGKYVLFLNPDTVIKPAALSKMIAFLEKQADCGGLGPRLLNPDSSLQLSCRAFPTIETQLYNTLFLDAIFTKTKLFGKYMMSWWQHNELREVDQPMGAALLVRKELLDKIGAFDETIIFWYDEVDLCYRIKQAGWKIYFLPEAEIIHYGGQAFGQWKGLRQSLRGAYIWRQSRNYFFKKHYGFWQVPILMFLDVLQAGIILALLYAIIKTIIFLLQTIV